ncbi:ABC transporter permease [Oscillospiraceae bacterium LBM23126]
MNFFESFELALKNIFSSKMRTFLTMLGIIIGVTAVIVIVGLGNGMEIYMRDSFASLGTNTLTVMITGRGSSRNVSVEDMYQIVADHPKELALLSPTATMMSSTVKIGDETASSATVTGVSEDYFEIKQYTVESGRGLQFIDIDRRKHVCVVGSYINKEWFDGKALGGTLKINGTAFTIVGVLKEEADSEEGGTDDAVYLPYSTAARLGTTRISSYILTVTDEDQASASKKVVEDELYDVFEDDNAYSVISMSEVLDTMTSMINIMISVLAIIAGISLVVGGIGIMNIMLVSVTERTREIGIRKALGAKERYIMSQFVIEAATTSALGGVIGIALGYGLSSIATQVITMVWDVNLPVTPSLPSVLLAFGISAGIGILFGYLPAKKAAVLNPIDALRYD